MVRYWLRVLHGLALYYDEVLQGCTVLCCATMRCYRAVQYCVVLLFYKALAYDGTGPSSTDTRYQCAVLHCAVPVLYRIVLC